MADASDLPQQTCPACGAIVNVAEAEPLATVLCPSCGEKLRVQRTFDHFEIVETLGVGGMGSVYKARDTRLERFVALKLLRKELSANPAEAALLEQEARVTAAVNHPNVVQVYSSGTAHGQIYLVMELVDHGSLDDLMAQHTRLPESQVLEAGIQVAKGLQAAQQKGLIHRDVKPANILFADTVTAKIGDFGLAVAVGQKSEALNEIWGTPYYVAPERLNNEPEDFRSDIYSLGATLFHALAGRPPMEGDTTSAAELRELKSRPPELQAVAPDISDETARIINKTLAPNPEDRFTSYADLIAELERAARAFRGDGNSNPRSRRGLLIAAAAVLAALLALGFYVFQKEKGVASSGAAAGPDASAKIAPLQQRYEEARRQLIDGKYDAATLAFTRLAADAKDHQPLLNWTRLHAGLAALLQGKPAPAREMFLQVERGGSFSTASTDAALASFFVETARRLTASGPVPEAAVAELDSKTVHAFGLLIFAVKNWQLREFDQANALFNRFASSEPAPPLSWIAEYKPIARKFLDDYRIYAERKEMPESFATAAEVRAAIDKLRALEKKLKMRGPLADALKDEATRLSKGLAQREKSEKETLAREKQELLARESPIWEAALAKSQRAIANYEYTEAIAALDVTSLTETSLKEAQITERKKAAWLAEWKTTLISDLNTKRYKAVITDIPNVPYEGVDSADESTITLRIPGGRGTAPVKWTQLIPKTLLAMSTAFIAANPTNAADRQWRSAVFASTTRQSEAARALAEAAAKTKSEYQDQLQLLTSATPDSK